ncbi:MAG: hypothetical protein KatS3mg102_1938 [Planctomycetota bacterium]|nr:MAG: hypothetical protein KatS3mg102_1938 [Planctomycetota bacterium]
MSWPAPPQHLVLVAPPLVLSGPALAACTLGRGLQAHGLGVVVLSPGGGLAPLLERAGVAHVALPWLAVRPLRALAGWLLGRRLRRLEPRLVHAVGVLQIELGMRLARAIRTPLFASVYRPSRRVPDRGIRWEAVALASVPSDALRQDLVNQRRAPRERVRVVPGGVEAGPEPPRLPLAEPRAAPVIGTVVEHDKPASAEVFLQAARSVLEVRPETQFLVAIGAETPQRALRQRAQELGLVRNLTFATAVELRRLLVEMDLCVLPDVEEGPTPVLLEAMAAARAVLAGAEGDAYAVVRDEQTGLLFPSANAEALAAALARLLAQPALAQQLGAAARRAVISDYPLERLVRDTLAMYARGGVELPAGSS